MESKQKRFTKAYEACHEPFVRYCSVLTYGKTDTKDLVQDVLLSAYLHFDKLTQKDQLLPYLIRAARNRSISLWRKTKFKAEWLDKHRERLIDQNVSADTLLDIDFLYKSIRSLPTKQAEAIILFEINGFSMKEIAAIQESTPGAVKTLISRGRTKLKQLFKNDQTKVNSAMQILKSIVL